LSNCACFPPHFHFFLRFSPPRSFLRARTLSVFPFGFNCYFFFYSSLLTQNVPSSPPKNTPFSFQLPPAWMTFLSFFYPPLEKPLLVLPVHNLRGKLFQGETSPLFSFEVFFPPPYQRSVNFFDTASVPPCERSLLGMLERTPNLQYPLPLSCSVLLGSFRICYFPLTLSFSEIQASEARFCRPNCLVCNADPCSCDVQTFFPFHSSNRLIRRVTLVPKGRSLLFFLQFILPILGFLWPSNGRTVVLWRLPLLFSSPFLERTPPCLFSFSFLL